LTFHKAPAHNRRRKGEHAMPSSAALRIQIESVLSHRIPAALSPVARQQRALAATGLPSLDHLLNGGLPIGAISELVGPLSSGRTTAALSFLAQRINDGHVCAWIDVHDALDPESAAANGVRLDQLLWVRCGSVPFRSSDANSPTGRPQPQPSTAASNARPASPSNAVSPALHGCSGSHPRSEAKGMDRAVEELMRRKAAHIRDKTIGTPGVSNRSLTPVLREEQVSSDRLPKRRGHPVPTRHEALSPRCAEASHHPRPEKSSPPISNFHPLKSRNASRTSAPIWTLLDQALRATDLLLQAGGFSAIVLDLGDTPPAFSSRIPLATWFRYRQAADQSRSSLIVLTQRACAGSSAEAVVRFDSLAMQNAGGRVLHSSQFRASVTRQRFTPSVEITSPRKPVASVSTWSSGMRDAV
jgi:recombination protein RecA